LQHLDADKFEVKEASLVEKPAWFTEIYLKAVGSNPESTGEEAPCAANRSYQGVQSCVTVVPTVCWLSGCRELAGQVPVLQHGDTIMVESAVVAEYADRKFAASPEARLLSDDPLERAEAQLFVERHSSKVVGGFYKLLMAKAADREELTA
jgi:hypothetical protein